MLGKSENKKNIDTLNQKAMQKNSGYYSKYQAPLSAPEVAVFDYLKKHHAGQRILDIGVGGGRLVQPLREISQSYLGVDYVHNMVDTCRRRFPEVEFQQADARAMPQFSDHSFDVIVFAWGGICMVDHPGRLAILAEVRRILKPGGCFVFSTYNTNSAEYTASFEFPVFKRAGLPLRLLPNAVDWAKTLVKRVYNRSRLKPREIRLAEYSIINDTYHDYSTYQYYISFSGQLNQLKQAGFNAGISVYDGRGQRVANPSDAIFGLMTFIVHG